MLVSMKIVEATAWGLQIRLEFLLNTRDGTMLILRKIYPAISQRTNWRLLPTILDTPLVYNKTACTIGNSGVVTHN